MNLKLISILQPYLVLAFVGILLVIYRLRKKFKQERQGTWKGVVDANMVEIILFLMFIALAAPDWGELLLEIGK